MSRRSRQGAGAQAAPAFLPSFDGDLLSAAAHELRTPLAVVAGYAELLQARDDEGLRAEGLLAITEAANELYGAVDEVMRLLALGSGNVEPEDSEELDLSASVGEAIAVVGARTSRHSLAALRNGEPWPLVRADEELLPQALMSVLRSACRVLPGGGDVLVGAMSRGGEAVVSVLALERGRGAVEFEELGPLAYTSGDEWPDRGALGLYATSRLLELMDGELTVEAAPGVGYRFSFTVPLAGNDAG